MFAAADMTLEFGGGGAVCAEGAPSALRFRESDEMGLISCPKRVSVVE